MQSTLIVNLHWAAGAVIEFVVFLCALRRKLFRRLPVFTIYLGLVIANEIVIWLVYTYIGIDSRTSFDIYWMLQAAQLLARAIVVYEICRELLSPYVGVWRLSRSFLILLGLALAGSATATARQQVHPISATTLMAERGLEFTVVGILILGLIFCRYYGVRIERHFAWIALGLGFYSAIQVANNTFLGTWFTRGDNLIWRDLRILSFNIATIFWLVALWKPLPARQPAPVLLDRSEYDRLAPQMTLRLRELNSRLLEMWK